MSKILVIAEIDNGAVRPSTAATIAAANAIGGDVDILTTDAATADTLAQFEGVNKVLAADADHLKHPTAEDITNLAKAYCEGYGHILVPATTFGKNFMPRLAALLDVQAISDITEVISADTFVRPIYAGNAMAHVQSADADKVITVRPTAFDPAPVGGSASVEKIDAPDPSGLSTYVGLDGTDPEKPDLTSAEVVISGGRGLGSGENFNLLETLAQKLGGAAIGASRAAVDAGWVPNDYQVGQTGKVVAPQLYIAVGISGAIQHLAGMKDSKVIVAINKDENAPIFDIATYGLVADLFDAVPELTEKL